MLMLSCSLLVDSVNGFFLSGLGIDPKLSAAFKLTLLVLILFQIGTYSFRALAGLLSLVLLLSIGPLISLVRTLEVSGFISDFTMLLKTVTSLIVFIYCVLICRFWPSLLQKYGKWCCQVSFTVLALNLILGVLGYGFSSYGSTTQDESDGIGVKGFFYAGNEVSGLLILFFGTTLHLLWQNHKLAYFLFSPIVLIAGLLVATKSAMLSAAVLVFVIPLFNERNRLLNITWLKVKMMFPILMVGSILMLVFIPILEAAGVWDRLVWFYQKKGIAGLILSGRDEFLMTSIAAYQQFASLPEILFGFGTTLSLIGSKSIEIDPLDLYFWFGLSGFLLFLLLAILFFRTSYLATQKSDSFWGPCVLVINIILFGVSCIAGHIFTSGMLAPFIGLVNGMAYADFYRKQGKLNNSSHREINANHNKT